MSVFSFIRVYLSHSFCFLLRERSFFIEKMVIATSRLTRFFSLFVWRCFYGGRVPLCVIECCAVPLGLSPFANELLFGMWTMVAPIAAMLIPRAGSAVLAEVLAALAEMLYGSYFGPSVLISGVIQGLGSESGFFVTRYKRYDTLTLFYSAIGTTIFSYVYEYFKFGYGNYGLGMNIALISVRFVSICFFGIFLTKVILRMYQSAQGLAVKAK